MTSPNHLNALRAFEASARHKSFAAAAEELHVTPAAVGQLVRGLEEWLGDSLFHRANSGKTRLIPTELAEQALPDIRAGFEKLSLGVERLKDGTRRSVLTVTVSPAFAAKWLLPRLHRFQAAWPDIDVHLDTNHKPVDFSRERVDIGVRYGPGKWKGVVAQELMHEEVYPVCSPQLLRDPERLKTPAALLDETLIHDLSMEGHDGFPSWNGWFKRAGLTDADSSRGLQINNSAAVLQAAIDGQGIALARGVMVHDDLVSGRLIRLFDGVMCASSLAYYVIHRPEVTHVAKVQAFREWLLEEAGLSCRIPSTSGS